MTYEILLYPRTPGQVWAEVIAADEADSPDMDLVTLNRGVASFRRIEARLRDQLTEPVRTWVPEALDGDILGELQTRDSGLRVDLYDRSALVSAPYGGAGAPGVDLVRQAVEIVAAETGYEAYDPQVGDTFDGSFHDKAGQASLSRVTDQDDLWAEADPSTSEGEAISPDAQTATPLEGRIVDDEDQDGPLDPRAERARLVQERRQQLLEQRREPGALRRRGWMYLVFGAVLTGLALLRLADGDTEVFTWLFLGIGVFELLGARVAFSQARQAQEQRDQPSNDPGQSPDTQSPSTLDDGTLHDGTLHDGTPDEGPDGTMQR